MKVVIELEPGEAHLTAEELAAKINRGFSAASREVLKGASRRDGEVRALKQLADEMERGFEAQLEEILREQNPE